MPQAIQIETQAKQQGLANLHRQAAAWGSRRELAFNRGEYALDQRATPIQSGRKCPSHFGTYSAYAPGLLPTLGGDHTSRSQLLPNVSVVSLAVEFGVGQHQADACLLGSRFDNGRQIRTIVPGTRRAICDSKNF